MPYSDHPSPYTNHIAERSLAWDSGSEQTRHMFWESAWYNCHMRALSGAQKWVRSWLFWLFLLVLWAITIIRSFGVQVAPLCKNMAAENGLHPRAAAHPRALLQESELPATTYSEEDPGHWLLGGRMSSPQSEALKACSPQQPRA